MIRARMTDFRLPTVYSVLQVGELPDNYEVECNWCRFNMVTPDNRCWVPVPQKNVVHQTCATGQRKMDKAGFFHCWECAMSFCFWWRGMDRYMDQVRIEAGKHGHIGAIVIQAPNPLITLKRFHPGVQGSKEETEAQYNQYLKDGVQVRELRYSEISSARIHRLYNSAEREAAHVMEHSTPDHPDLRAAVASIETVEEGDVIGRAGAYKDYMVAKDKQLVKPVTSKNNAHTNKSKSKTTSKGGSSQVNKGEVQFQPLF
jgi:hypothetical protein